MMYSSDFLRKMGTVWTVAFLCVIGLSSCMDDEKLPFTAKLPYTSLEDPIMSGDTVLVKGNGFDGNESVRIEGYELDDSGTRVTREWNAEIVDVTDSALKFIMPEGVKEHCSVYLIHAGYEMELGYLTLGKSNDQMHPEVYRGHMVDNIQTDRGDYQFTYEKSDNGNRLYGVLFTSMKERREFYFKYLSREELVVVSNETQGVLHCRLNDNGLLEDIFRSVDGTDELEPLIRIAREETKMSIRDEERHIRYLWRKDGSSGKMLVQDDITGKELRRMNIPYKGDVGVPNDANIDLNAPVSFVFENELLNILNMCGYLIPREKYLALGHNYMEGSNEEEYQANFSRVYYIWSKDEKNRPRTMEVQDMGSSQCWRMFMNVIYAD